MSASGLHSEAIGQPVGGPSDSLYGKTLAWRRPSPSAAGAQLGRPVWGWPKEIAPQLRSPPGTSLAPTTSFRRAMACAAAEALSWPHTAAAGRRGSSRPSMVTVLPMRAASPN